MPFELTNVPMIFQHMISDIFWEFMDYFILVYLHDILIFSVNSRGTNHTCPPHPHQVPQAQALNQTREIWVWLHLSGIPPYGIIMEEGCHDPSLGSYDPCHGCPILPGFHTYRQFTQSLIALIHKNRSFQWTSNAKLMLETLTKTLPWLLWTHIIIQLDPSLWKWMHSSFPLTLSCPNWMTMDICTLYSFTRSSHLQRSNTRCMISSSQQSSPCFEK